MIFKLAFKSLKNRKLTSSLTLLSISLGIALFMGIEQVRLGVRESFSGAVSQTDLIVGARGGSLPLLLYSIFHIGNATNNLSYSSYQKFKKHPAVKWTIPLSLGDSHRGFRVVATDENFYREYHYRGVGNIEFLNGRAASQIWDVVLGYDVAHLLHYSVGQQVTLSHGIATDGANFYDHHDKPFHIVGILKKTATPLDRSLYITLEGMEAIHIDWKDGAPPIPGEETKPDQIDPSKIKIGQITAFLLRAKSRIDALYLQREINDFEGEPLMAIIPGVALAELWGGLGYAEDALRVVSFFVIVASFLGMLVSLLTSLNERRREMAILRSLGTSAFSIISLLVMEAVLLAFLGVLFGLLIDYGGLYLAQSSIASVFGFFIPIHSPTLEQYCYLGILLLAAAFIGFIPALKAFKNSLTDGLSSKI
ncbi:MAG: peptide transporter permease [Bacteriovoracaceae bacterium]|nr:peptide transporter permease [Bacteriovoracaceae bacterium]